MREEFDDHEFDDFFRERFQDYQSDPPFSWEEIQSTLPPSSPQRSRRRWLITFITGVFLMGTWGGEGLLQQEPNFNNSVISTDSEEKLKTTSPKVSEVKAPSTTQSSDLSSVLKPSNLPEDEHSSSSRKSIKEVQELVEKNLNQSQEPSTPSDKRFRPVLKNTSSPTLLGKQLNYGLNLSLIHRLGFEKDQLKGLDITRHLNEVPMGEEKSIIKPYYLNISVGPTLAYYRLTPNQLDDKLIFDIPESAYSINENLGFRVDVQFEKRFSKHWSGGFGLMYSKQESQLTYTYSPQQADSLAVDVVNRNELFVNPIRQDIQKEIRFRSEAWGFQGNAHYHFGGKWQNHSIGWGMSYEQIQRQDFQRIEGNTRQPNWSIALDFNYRWTKDIGPRWQVRIEPYIHYYFRSFYQDSAVRLLRPYQLSVRLGLNYRLR